MNKILATTVIAAGSILPSFSHSTYAEAVTTVQISKNIPIHATHSITSDTLLTTEQTTNATVLSLIKDNTIKWIQVKLTTGQTGWVQSTQLHFSAQKIIVTGSDVNVRKGASTAYPSITKLQKGMQLSALSQFINDKGELWYEVDLGNGKKGWAISAYFKPVAAPATYSNQTSLNAKMIINTPLAEVRKGASLSYPVSVTLKRNTPVILLSQFTNTAGEKWARIQSETTTGWVKEAVLSRPEVKPYVGKTLKTNTAGALVRKGASAAYAAVITLPAQTSIKVIDQYTNSKKELWLRVEVLGKTGWISAKQVTLPTATLNQTSYYIANHNTLVRKGASSTYEAAATLARGTKVLIVSEHTAASGEKWFRIEFAPGKYAWTPAKSLTNTMPVTQSIYTTVDKANVRKGAATTYGVVTSLSKGTALSVLSQSAASDGTAWYQVQYSMTGSGWIHSSIISTKSVAISQKKTIGTRSAKLYSGADLTYKVITPLPNGSAVTALKEYINSYGQKWYSVRTASGVIGWTPSWEAYNAGQSVPTVYAKSKTVLLKGAFADSGTAASLTAGSPLKLLWSLDNWYFTENASGVRGWIVKDLTTTSIPKSLRSPALAKLAGDAHSIKWTKAGAGAVKYTMNGTSQIKITGDATQIEVPSFKTPGVTSYSVATNTNGTQTLTVNIASTHTFTIRNYKESMTLKVMPKGLIGKKIIIDAGHGAHDVGAVGPTRLYEKTVNLETALKLKKELEAYGASVIMTRSTDIFLELPDRTAISNASDADAFISVHSNSHSSTSRGTQTFYNTSVSFNGPKSKTLAMYVQNSLYPEIWTYNRGYTHQTFYVNRMNEIPSALVELAFISNPAEEKLMRTDSFKQKAAVGIRKGLQNYFNN
ncbi:SH3 domain-containing protein [Fictibacillus iocasae]|uniref:SH3 domain-containing protein n=1 Tax=Fictibacillus iocasae TaxID=2715437 RepID=A0ABW2NVS3_9BACL